LIVCKQCGHHNEDNDTFCGSCGKFLEWTGERVAVAEPEPPPPVVEPEPEPVHHGLIDRVKQAVGIEETATAPTAADRAPTTPAPAPTAAPAAPRAAAPLRSVPVSSAPAAATAPEPVLAGVAAPGPPSVAPAPPPVSADEPLSRRPTSVAPTITRPRPGLRRVEQPTRRHAGDLICGQCGEGNDPTRHFCRRCGSELAEAVAVQQPWYRRILNRLFGDRTREAGWRPNRVGGPNVTGMFMRVVRLAIAAVLVIGVLAFLLIPPFRNAVVNKVTAGVTAIRKIVHPNFDPIHPVGANATTSTPGHLPPLAIDTFANTYWAASANDKAPVLILRFSGPVDLAEIGVTSGASGTAPQDQFVAQPRPHQVHLVFSNGYTADLALSDIKTAQFNPIDAQQVTSVEIHVLSTWAPAGAAPSSVAIAEVEFRTKD
jgi:ribosomal protein L40E